MTKTEVFYYVLFCACSLRYNRSFLRGTNTQQKWKPTAFPYNRVVKSDNFSDICNSAVFFNDFRSHIKLWRLSPAIYCLLWTTRLDITYIFIAYISVIDVQSISFVKTEYDLCITYTCSAKDMLFELDSGLDWLKGITL